MSEKNDSRLMRQQFARPRDQFELCIDKIWVFLKSIEKFLQRKRSIVSRVGFGGIQNGKEYKEEYLKR
ncbi:hypothetical protein J6590_022765 [Homalodisca vitripennis]|nr:hypothetical protein J6590_022765 [Homalodisca vitripennis]